MHIAGHSHYPVNDPRSVWQGNYIAIGTGSVYYSEFTVDTARAYHPADAGQTANCWIVDLDADSNMRLRGYDVNEEKQLCEVYLNNPADPKNRDYTPAKQKAASRAPIFAENAAPAAETSFGGCTVTVPAAISADGQPVVLYRAAARNRFGATLAENWALPTYYRALTQASVELSLSGLPEGEYTISVIAENAYGKQSAPIQTTVSIPGERGFRRLIVRIRYLFDKIITFFKQIFG